MLKIVIATDGSCLGNPGVGGYAAVMQAKGKTKEISGFYKGTTTNNKMELRAVIFAIDWLNDVQKESCEIEVQTDSAYVVNTSRKSRKELTASSRSNHDLWLELITKGLKGGHRITFTKIEGHSGHPLNERADKLAREAAKKAQKGE